ncbi:hypothetical protein CSUB01_12051, partial [Colletotrichum sublineola]
EDILDALERRGFGHDAPQPSHAQIQRSPTTTVSLAQGKRRDPELMHQIAREVGLDLNVTDSPSKVIFPGKPGGGGRHMRKPVTLSAVIERKFGDAVDYLIRTSSRRGGRDRTITEDRREHDVAALRKDAGGGDKAKGEAAERDVDVLVIRFGHL